ncbi:hypothetical protein J1N35_011597 [Gossypium stocksii]|uniref:Uncharacterized protein n=1 Tax=Gossypium stocksii TaxID=47602 RepID=A0A9D3W2A5_9ROSI|nr:hypothetical protein J1N35_011597 [Gossypium stocksii]
MENFDYRWFNDERNCWDDEWNYITGWLNRVTTNQWSNDKGCEDNEFSYEPLYESYDKDDDIPKPSDGSFYDQHKIPSCETFKPSNFERLSNMSDMMEQMRKMLQEISKALPLKEEVVHPNLNPEDPCFIINHPELDNNSQQEFGTRDHGDELKMAEVVSDTIDVETTRTVDVAVDVKVEVTTNMELNPI